MTVRLLLIVLLGAFKLSNAQNDFLAKINTIVKSKALDEAKKSCFTEFWTAQNIENGQACFSKYIQKNYSFSLVKDTTEDALKIVTSTYKSSGNDSGKVYFYLAKSPSDGQWLIEGINNDDQHYNLYLDKKVKAYFNIKQLPQHPELNNLGKKIAQNNKKDKADLNITMLDTTGNKELYQELRKLKNLELVSTHFSQENNKGMIIMKHTTPEGTKEFNLYLQKTEGQNNMWKLYDQNHLTPHLDLFFK